MMKRNGMGTVVGSWLDAEVKPLGRRIDGETTSAPASGVEAAAGPLLSPPRYGVLDAARGVALLAMAVYHFSWDLAFQGYIGADVGGDLGWRIFARSIASTFLFLVGVSLVLAVRRGFNRSRFVRRLALVAVSAGAITVATYFIFPDSYIFFGILHHIAVASLLALPFIRLPIVIVAATALAVIAAPHLISAPIFDEGPLLWVGLGTTLPRSNDYVPIFPWFGVVLLGVLAARLALRRDWTVPQPRPASKPFIWAGRHSLFIYLIHQPILFGLVAVAAMVVPPAMNGMERGFARAFVSACTDAGSSGAVCEATRACLTNRLKADGLWEPLMTTGLDAVGTSRYYGLADECRAAADLAK